MSECLLIAFAFVLMIEGLLPFLAPRIWRGTFRRLCEMQDGQLRFLGLISIGAGIILMWMAR
jgi:uncharacterized protein YjeT (DUF2065 family)